MEYYARFDKESYVRTIPRNLAQKPALQTADCRQLHQSIILELNDIVR